MDVKTSADIIHWMERKFGEINYYLIQQLSGHGYFCMEKMTRPNCICDDALIDSAELSFIVRDAD